MIKLIALFFILAVLFFTQTSVSADFTCCPSWTTNRGNECQLNEFDGKPIPANKCTEGQTCNTSSGKCEGGSKTVENVIGKIEPPEAIRNIGPGGEGLNNFLNKILELIFTVATLAFVFMVLISGLQWILSGGDKEGVKSARERLTWAIIGMVFLALAFVILRVFGQILGFEFFAGQNLPTPTPNPIKTPFNTPVKWE